jgi:uncharacterized protein YbjT (DUF2867 family)
VQTLVTGISGYVGAALAPRLRADGHRVRGFTRSAARVRAQTDDLVEGDALSGEGLGRALDGVEVAYYLIHSMEGAQGRSVFPEQERTAAERFAQAAAQAGVRRIVYLGGLLPPAGAVPSRHLASRLAVEEALLAGAPESIALRASIVIGARSRSFRFLVRLIERLPVLALPGWRVHRTQPIDGRDVLEFLRTAATGPASLAGSWDAAGPDLMTYQELIARIADAMLVRRPTWGLNLNVTPVASVVAAAVAGEDIGLIGPLMESLEHDLLPRDDRAAEAFGVRLHGFDAAVERALGEWEREEALRAR